MPRKNRQIKHIPLQMINSCDSKRKFKTEKQAREAAEYQMLLTLGLEIGVYQCQMCRMWHLTQVNKKNI